jgi:hypothetical protein
MEHKKALVRQYLELIDQVTRTWFEFELENEVWLKTLVVEVSIDTDPNTSPDLRAVLENIRLTVIENQTTMVINRVKVVSKAAR